MLKLVDVQYFLKLLSLVFAVTIISIHCVFAKYASNCTTTEIENGICMPIKSCATAYETIKNSVNLDAVAYNSAVQKLRESQCYYENAMPYVCCPTTEIQINPDIYAHLSQLNCGISSNRKIARGEAADINAYRWSALLGYSADGEIKFRCGGALISERYVLTAAHCFQEIPAIVRLGEYDLRTEIDCITTRRGQICSEPHEDIGIEKFFMPDNYVSNGLHNDIALIRLQRPVEFKKNIRPICLPISKELQGSFVDSFLVAGWGRTENATSSDVLMYTNIPYRTREYCEQNLRLPRNQHLTEGHICAGGERFRDSCKGDSGGAIFLPDLYTDGVARTIQFGVVSLGVRSCGQRNAPAIYTNVSHYIQWITDQMTVD